MEQLTYLASEQIGTVVILICLAIATILEKSKSKFNPWTSLLKMIGRGINAELFERINTVDKGVESLRKNVDKLGNRFEEQNAVNARSRILRFGDEIRHNVLHSKDHYDQIMLDITFYENYCNEHKDFSNSITEATAHIIREKYKVHLENNTFLV